MWGRAVAEPIQLSVILPAYNEAGRIRDTLTAMRAFLADQGYCYEVIVAADGDDATARIVSDVGLDWPQLKLEASPARQGKGHGLRRGAALARGEIEIGRA